MSTRLTTIELSRENMTFSAGHFTIFSATEREALHGHNFSIYAALTTVVDELGISFDYDIYKKKIKKLCGELNNIFLLPTKSPYLEIKQDNHHYYAHFNKEKIPFLKRDIKLLPVRNISVEDLADWFVQQLINDKKAIKAHQIKQITIKVFSAPGQCGSASWQLFE